MKKKKIHKRKKDSSNIRNENASEMIRNIADEFISMGDTIERRQCYLNLACAAWNISLLPVDQREDAINDYIEAMMKLNNRWTDQDTNGTFHNMNIFISDKIKYYPKVNRIIVRAELTVVDGKEQLTVASVNMDKISQSNYRLKPTAAAGTA